MRAGVTELRNTRSAARKRHLGSLANDAQTTSGGRGRRHLANDYETRRVIAAGSRRRVTRRGAAGAKQRAPKARVELRRTGNYS